MTDLGYDPGPPGEGHRPVGRRAIERYQAAAGLEIDGEVTPALLASLREAQAAKTSSSDVPSMRTEIGEDGVMREIDEPPEVSKSGAPSTIRPRAMERRGQMASSVTDVPRSSAPEPEAVSEPAPIDLVFGAGISPAEADIVFTSTDDTGRPGKLTQDVFGWLSVCGPRAFRLVPTDLKKGFTPPA